MRTNVLQQVREDLKRIGNGKGLVEQSVALTRAVYTHIHDGRFQCSLALVTAISSFVSGLEVAYEHYKGSYSNRIMYSPVVLSGVLTVAGISGAMNRTAAQTFLRWTSAVTLADGVTGFVFHIRGIARKPGGWRLPITNIVMGPPLFAPLLFGTAAYLGFLASFLRRETDAEEPAQYTGRTYEDLSHGYFQKHLAILAAVWSVCSGFEAWYSHYKNNFGYKVQWSPILLTPLILAACIGTVLNKKAARTLLPAVSVLTMVDGGVGFVMHGRGIARRSGGLKNWLYNVLYGPPIFAPLLFAACGTLGVLSSLLRREER